MGFDEEEDEVGYPDGEEKKTFASLFKMHQTKYCGDHASMCTVNDQRVPEVDATKMREVGGVPRVILGHTYANTPTVVFNSLALGASLKFKKEFKDLEKGKTTFSFNALKTVMEKVCDKATNVVTKDKGLDSHGLPGPCAVATEVVLLIEGIFGEDGAKMIENVLPVKSSWTKTAANYVFDMDENKLDMESGKHLHEKKWSAMAFDGKNTHAMEDAILADREKSSGYELFQRIRKNKNMTAAAFFKAGITRSRGRLHGSVMAQMKQRQADPMLSKQALGLYLRSKHASGPLPEV